MRAIWGDGGLCPPKTISRDSAQAWKLLKENKEVISVNHWDRGSDSSPSPTACRLVNSSRSFFRCYLVPQFVCEITKGEAREEIWSSVNYLFFISTSLICQLQIGTCHLPLQGLNHVLLQLLTFNTLWKEYRVESRNEALCALGKTGRTGLQTDIFRSRFYEPNFCISSYLEKH